MFRGIFPAVLFIIYFIHQADLRTVGAQSEFEGRSQSPLKYDLGKGGRSEIGYSGGASVNYQGGSSWSITNIIKWVISMLGKIITLPITIPSNILSSIGSAIGSILNTPIFKIPIKIISQIISSIGNTIKSVIKGIWNMLIQIANLNADVIGAIRDIIQKVLGFIVEKLVNFQIFQIKIFYNIAMWIKARMEDIVQAICNIIIWIATQIVNGVRGVMNMVHSLGLLRLPVIKQITTVISSIHNWKLDQICKMATDFMGFVKKIVLNNRNFFGPIFNWILNMLTAISQAMQSLKATGNIPELFFVIDNIKYVLDNIRIGDKSISDYCNDLLEFMKNVGKGYSGHHENIWAILNNAIGSISAFSRGLGGGSLSGKASLGGSSSVSLGDLIGQLGGYFKGGVPSSGSLGGDKSKDKGLGGLGGGSYSGKVSLGGSSSGSLGDLIGQLGGGGYFKGGVSSSGSLGGGKSKENGLYIGEE